MPNYSADYKRALESKRTYWQSTVKKWQRSGLSMPEFCRQNEVELDQFYYWKRKYAGIGSMPTEDSKREFVELKVTDSTNPDESKHDAAPSSTLRMEHKLELSIVLHNDLKLQIKTNMSDLQPLLSSLGSLQC